LLQYGSTMCLASCPVGFYVNSNNDKCLKCDDNCKECQGTATNCLKCGPINNVNYFLTDSNLNDANLGGSCTTNCGTGRFGN
jgi:hypothetical protein